MQSWGRRVRLGDGKSVFLVGRMPGRCLEFEEKSWDG